MSMLSAQDLAVGYGGHPLARGIALALEPGTITCLIGPNGVGKTTFFKTLLGFLPPVEGRVLLGGKDLATLGRAEIARAVALVPQAHAGAFAFTALDLVLMGRTMHLGMFAGPGRADREIAMAALDSMGVADLAERDIDRISGGQRQLVLIARALAQKAGTIIMDEPTASLDLGNRVRVLDRIASLAGEGLAVLVSTHEPEQAFSLAHRVAVIGPSGVFEQGAPDEILTPERLSVLYGAGLTVEATPSGRRVVGPAVI